MKLAIVTHAFCCLLACGAAQAATTLTNHYIITCRPGVDSLSVAGECQGKAKQVYPHALRGFAASLSPGEVEKLRKDKRILAVEPDGQVEVCGQTNGAGIIRMGLTNFPIARINGVDERIDVDVAVIDTGIQLDHPDLNVVHAVDFTGEDRNGEDWYGHGTHVAGILGALDNDFGVVGVAPGVRLWSVQVIGATNSLWSQVLAGFDYVAQHADQIAVANCSFGSVGSVPVVATRAAVSNLVRLGVVIVAATGNDRRDITGTDRVWGTGDDIYPAALHEVMAVSGVNPTNDTFYYFSNFGFFQRLGNFVASPGGVIDVAAPAVGILSTWTNSGYYTASGTSTACPHASGLVALYIAEYGRAHSAPEVYAIRQRIVDSALPQSQWRTNWNHGNTEDRDVIFPEPMALAVVNWIPVVGVAPVLTLKPQDQTAMTGSNATFNAVAAGSPLLHFRWQFNGTNLADNERISGTESNVLSLAGVTANDFGNYQLIVTNTYGSIPSALVRLSLPPVCVSAWPGLVAWWRAEGNAFDSAGTNHGILAGTTYGSGKVGQAFSLHEGYGPTVPALNFGGRNAMTIEGWIKPIGQLDYWEAGILRQASASASDWVLKFKNDFGNAKLLSFGLNAGGAYNELSVPIAAADFDYRDGNWHHVAATYDGSMKRIHSHPMG